MMTRTGDLETTINLPNEEEIDVLVDFTICSWGSPGCGPSWNHPGDPPEPPEFEIDKITRLVGGVIDVEMLTEKEARKLYDTVAERICEIDEALNYYEDE